MKVLIGSETTSFATRRTLVKAKQVLKKVKEPIMIAALAVSTVLLSSVAISIMFKITDGMTYTSYMF